MSKVSVLDASAALAYLQAERGHERVEGALDEGPCRISAVNACEVLGKLCDRGMPPQEALAVLNDLGLTVVSFDAGLAAIAAFMRRRTRPIGASLGDRACLALAEHLAAAGDAPAVFTTERSWTRLKWSFKIVVIR